MYEEILDVAEQLFMTQGYRATSTRQITEKLGVTQPTLYYHFKKKEDIYYHVMLRLSETVETELRKIATNPNYTVEEKILHMALFLQQKHPFNLFVMMHDIQHTLSKEMSQKLYQLWIKSYRAPFIELFEQNQFHLKNEIDPSFAVSQLFILIASYLETPNRQVDLSKSVHVFLYGVIEGKVE
ncbi:TetR/AcrR family transcriptional regulator [Enterococcus sp. AZ102]|uniref:TetR/AcrR family transcriptional regulator n=1 Tax=unclassified Enterococcus TaxID=2608891 RepID=UPI003F1FBA15